MRGEKVNQEYTYEELLKDRERLDWLVQFLLYEDDGTKVRLDDGNGLSTGWHEDWRDAIDEAMKDE